MAIESPEPPAYTVTPPPPMPENTEREFMPSGPIQVNQDALKRLRSLQSGDRFWMISSLEEGQADTLYYVTVRSDKPWVICLHFSARPERWEYELSFNRHNGDIYAGSCVMRDDMLKLKRLLESLRHATREEYETMAYGA